MRRLEEEHVQVIDSWPHPSSRTRLARDQRLIHALLDECNHGQVALSDAGVADRLIGCWPDGSRFDLVMATAHDVRVHERPPPTGTTPEDRPLTLSEEHGLLLRQVAIRAGEVLAMTADGGWPTRELQALLTYMRAEVLRQAVDEERLLFPSHSSTSTVGGLAATTPPCTS